MTEAVLRDVIPQMLPVRLPAGFAGVLQRTLGIRKMERVYESLRAMGGDAPLPERLLRHLEVVTRISETDLKHIPRQGPVVLLANHPFGILEGAVLAACLLRLRSDVKVLANGVLAVIPELRDLVISVDPLGGKNAVRANWRGISEAVRFLAQGGLLVIFPAGEVSHFQWKSRSVTDPPWNPRVARLIARVASRVPEVSLCPVYVGGSNSVAFQLSGLLHPRLRTAMLGRELLNKRREQVEVRIASPIPVQKLLAIASDEERIEYLRWRTYLLASRNEFRPRTSLPLLRRNIRAFPLESLAKPVDGAEMSREVDALPVARRLAASGDLAVYLAQANEIPQVLAELGRLRELTFRSAGEGTGRSTDLDRFDPHYSHLFLWNDRKKEVAGAYRLAGTDVVRDRFGVAGLYTATLFSYGDEFLDRTGPALELGRSFIRKEYQRGFAPLLLLWKGIGTYVAMHPRYKILFGPVSISNQYNSVSRRLMVSFLERYAGLQDWSGLVSTRHPFKPERATAFDLEDLSAMVSDLEPTRAGVPVLLRQYLKLGGKLLGFSVDPQFADALDGLILVDLTKTDPKLLERYLGKTEAAQFLEFQRGTYALQ